MHGNKFMGDVDLADQYASSYNNAWKSRRWWMKLMYYMIDSCNVNSFIIYKSEMRKTGCGRFLSHLQFRSNLVNQLIGTFTSRENSGQGPSSGRARKRNHPDGAQTV